MPIRTATTRPSLPSRARITRMHWMPQSRMTAKLIARNRCRTSPVSRPRRDQGLPHPQSGYMVRDGKPKGFFYLDHRTVDEKYGLHRHEVAIGSPRVLQASRGPLLSGQLDLLAVCEGRCTWGILAYLQGAFADSQIFADYLEGLGKFM